MYTASFDPTAPNYFRNVLNSDPYKLQQAGHYLYASWDIHPSLAVVTGSGLTNISQSAGYNGGIESAAFILTGSLGRDVGSSTVPNYENWENRFSHAKSPWVLSQKFGGAPKKLFRFWMLDAGAGVQLPDGFNPKAYRGFGQVVDLPESLEVSLHGDDSSGVLEAVVTKGGAPFRITITNPSGEVGIPGFEIYVTFHE